jgi:hypothetical protein
MEVNVATQHKFISLDFFYDEDSNKYFSGMNIFLDDTHIVAVMLQLENEDFEDLITETILKVTPLFYKIIPIAYVFKAGESTPMEIDMRDLTDVDYDWKTHTFDIDDEDISEYIKTNNLAFIDVSGEIH